MCGNGIVEAGEACDDGHQTACGPCNASCTGPGTGSVCGDNDACPDTESCDDGDTIVCGTCNATCSGPGQASNCCIAPNPNNLVTNPGFDSNSIAGWKAFDPQITMSYAPVDATTCSTSGSILLTNSAPNGLNSGAYTCISVVPGSTYNVGGRVRIPSGGAAGQTFLHFLFTDQANCFGTFVGTQVLLGSSGAFDTWEYLHQENLSVPANAVSMQVYGAIIKNFPNTKSYQSYYDMLYVTPAPGKY